MCNILQDAIDNWPEDDATIEGEFYLSLDDYTEAELAQHIQKLEKHWDKILETPEDKERFWTKFYAVISPTLF